MSLVGTRPPTVDEWEQYELHHRSRMSTKPGITGMWQVSGRSDITDFAVFRIQRYNRTRTKLGGDVAIPNKEIAFVYEKEILNRTNQNGVSVSISQAVFSGNAQKLQDLLEDFMLRSISSMDGANEGFYHGMMLGLCAVLGNRYRIRSNREAGLGRFDIQLSPLVSGIPGFLFEFKHTKDERVNLAVLADSALQQINEKKYDTELRNAGVNSIIKIGIAFRGKNAVVKRG